MTQQGGQGAASSDPHSADRHAHEGIVLPADGSEPLMPGTTGDHVAPAGGSPWGQPWGPAPADPQPGAGRPWDAHQQQYGTATPLPAEGAPHQDYAQDASYGGRPAGDSYGGQGTYNGQQQAGAYNDQQQAGAYNGQQQAGAYGGQTPGGAYGAQQQGGSYGPPQNADAPYGGQPQGGQYTGGQQAGQPTGHVPGGQPAGQSQGGQHAGQPQGELYGGQSQGGQHAGQPTGGQHAGQPAAHAQGGQHAGQPAAHAQGGQHAGQPQGEPYAGQSLGGQQAGLPQGGQHAAQSQGGQHSGQLTGSQQAGQSQGGQHAGQPTGGQHAGLPQGGQHAAQAAGGAHARPAAGGAHAGQPGNASNPGQSAGASYPGRPADASYPGQPLPQAGQAGQLPPGGSGAGAPLPPVAGGLAPLAAAGAGDADATQYIPATPAADEGATQYIPATPAAGAGVDEGATQYIPPVAPGALPPEAPAGEGTQFLGRTPMPPAAGSDNEPTQFIAPVPAEPGKAPFGIRPGAPGDRQPPAEFDSLFRTEAPESEGPASTQQMPRFEPPQPAGHGQGGDGGGRAARRAAAAAPAARGGGRTGSKVPLFAAVGVVIALVGVGAGALLSGGGGDEEKDSPQTVSESAPADEKPSPSVDPVKEQAVALDKLLADSNNSRDSVIGAVRNVGKCTDLAQSATDLRNAAKQRNGLVTRLSQLSVDKLPANAQLTASLTKAWKASAAADNHYAAWAGQVAGKKGCKKGHARTTPQAVAGNKSSGEATTAKQEAAGLWNTIAEQYGLTTRDKSQL
ncbi:hypothetical protein [Streptomyces sp. NPDC002853]